MEIPEEWKDWPLAQVREELTYDMEGAWDHIEQNVNPGRLQDGLGPISRGASDVLCVVITNFNEDHRQGRVSREDLRAAGDAFVISCPDVPEVRIRERLDFEALLSQPLTTDRGKIFVLDAPRSVKEPTQVSQSEQVPKWQKNMAPQVQRRLGGKDHRYRGGGKGRGSR